MSFGLPEQTFTPWFHTPYIRAGDTSSLARAPPDFTAPRPATGTEDDEDEPEDEHPDENEASARETKKVTESTEKLETGDEDGTQLGMPAPRLRAPR